MDTIKTAFSDTDIHEALAKHQADFAEACKPVIKWLNNNVPSPHSKIIIDNVSAELVSGCMAISTEEFLHD